MTGWQRIGFVVIAVAIGTAPASAQERDRPNALSITATVVSAAADAGDQAKSNEPAALYPGDEVHYRLVFTNVVDVPVRNIRFTDRIPAGLVYVPGSSRSDGDDVTTEYSIDGGRTYTATPMVDTIIDGQPARRPAAPSEYTHIRWIVDDLIQPQAQVTAEFRATLPDTSQPRTPSSSRTGRDR